jgi:hypothetical protein
MTFLGGGSMPLTNGAGFESGSGSWIRILDPDPTILVTDLQDVHTKKESFFLNVLLIFTSFFKDKKSKRVKK